MEYVIKDDIKEYFYDKLVSSSFDFFEKVNPNYKEHKQFMPILINCGNTFLSKLLIGKILHSMFPNDKLFTSNYEHKLAVNKSVVFNVKMSKNHMEINPSEYGLNDRSIVGEFLLETSSMKNIVSGNKKNIIIWNIDKLGSIAFESLQNVIKDNEDTANFICVSNNIMNIEHSILSIVLPIDISYPDEYFYRDYFCKFGIDESLLDSIKMGNTSYNFNNFLKNICINTYFNKNEFKNSLKDFIQKFYYKITSKSKISESFIEDVRGTLYDLYVYHFSYDEIINIFLDFVLIDERIVEEKKKMILENACFFCNTCGKGNKQVIHLEGFIFNFLNIIADVRKNKA